MSRYSNSKLRKKDNKTFRGVTTYKKIPETSEDIWVITQYGDRLDLLSTQFYGNPNLWWFIAKANELTTLKIPDGTSLRIPPLSNNSTDEFIDS